jgi:hypothetical protein
MVILEVFRSIQNELEFVPEILSELRLDSVSGDTLCLSAFLVGLSLLLVPQEFTSFTIRCRAIAKIPTEDN